MKAGSIVLAIVLIVAAWWTIGALVRAFNPLVTNKAGPNWTWRLGRYDPFRNVFYRQDGSFRKHGRVALVTGLVLFLCLVLFVQCLVGKGEKKVSLREIRI